MKNYMEEAVKYFEDMGIPIKNGLIDTGILTDKELKILKNWENITKVNGIMMPKIEDFYRSIFVAISLNPQKNESGKIKYLFGKGIGVEIALRGKIQGKNIYEQEPIYRSHSDFELYNAKEDVYTPNFKEIFGSQEYYPPTKTKVLRNIPEEEMDNTYEIVNLDGYEILIPKLEILFLDKFLRKEATPRESGYDCELLAERYDLDKTLVYEYLEKYHFNYAIDKERKIEELTKSDFQVQIIKNLNSEIEDDEQITIEEAIESLNGRIESLKQINENIILNGIKINTYIPLTMQDILINEQNELILTQEYINRVMELISNKENFIIENMQNVTLQELNKLFERINVKRIQKDELEK